MAISDTVNLGYNQLGHNQFSGPVFIIFKYCTEKADYNRVRPQSTFFLKKYTLSMKFKSNLIKNRGE